MNLHQTPGCLMESDRFYIFASVTGAQITDQPRRGFRCAADALNFLRYQEAELRSFVVAEGRDAEPS